MNQGAEQPHPEERRPNHQSIVNGKYVGNSNLSTSAPNSALDNRVSKANVAFAFGENRLKNIRKEN